MNQEKVKKEECIKRAVEQFAWLLLESIDEKNKKAGRKLKSKKEVKKYEKRKSR
jgi:hypothetical protein